MRKLIAGLLVGLGLCAQGAIGDPIANGPSAPWRVPRQMPDGFKAAAAAFESRMRYLNRELPGILLIEKTGGMKARPEPHLYILLPQSVIPLIKVMVELGFDADASTKWASRAEFRSGERSCVLLAERLQSCVDLWISESPGSGENYVDLMTADSRTPVVSETASSVGMIGSSALSLGRSGGGIQPSSDYLSLTSRAIVSRGQSTFEYDLTASSQGVHSTPPPPTVNPSGSALAAGEITARPGVSAAGDRIGRLEYRVLAAGRQLGENGRFYAGYFPAANAGFQQAGGNPFFAQASIVGLAFKSDGVAVNAYGGRQRIRLQLLENQQVRILSGGTELFSGVVGSGEQFVEFDGYAEPFVEVSLRDSLGRVDRRRVEVMPAASETAGRMAAAAPVRSSYYLDAGALLTHRGVDNRWLSTSDVYQASFSYLYSGDSRRYQIGAQFIGLRRRLALSLADKGFDWRAGTMLGNQGEYGWSATQSWNLPAGIQLGWGAIDYRAPGTTSLADAGDGAGAYSASTSDVAEYRSSGLSRAACQAWGNALCFSNSHYRSVNISASVRDFPVRFGWYATWTPFYSSRQATLSVSSQVRINRWTASLQGFVSYEAQSGSRSVFVALILPMEGETLVSSSLSTDLEGRHSANVGFARSFEGTDGGYFRSVSAGISRQGAYSGQDGLSAKSVSGTVSAFGQWGAVSQSSSVAWAGHGGGQSINTVLTTSYAADAQGVSFVDRNAGAIGTQLFNDGSSAGVSVLNRSEESQRVSFDGASYEVPARTSRFLPRSPGGLGEVQASPGPVADLVSAQARTVLHRGNVRTLVIADGFWAIESFETIDATGGRLTVSPEYTYKSEGAEIVRLYPDSRQRSLVYETRDEGPELTRFITVRGQARPLICRSQNVAEATSANRAAAYRPVRMSCTPVDSLPAVGASPRGPG